MTIETGPFDWLTDDTLEDEEIANVVQQAGFSSTRRHRNIREDVTAIAVVLAESGGDPTAHNDTPPDDSYGLFQINMYGDLRDERAQRYNLDSLANLYEPRKNAEVAYDIFQRAGSFRPWSVYTSGSYLRFIPRAQAAADNPSEGIPTLGDTASRNVPGASALADISSLAEFVTNEDNWRRVALFVGGGALIIVGLVLALTGQARRIAGSVIRNRIGGK